MPCSIKAPKPTIIEYTVSGNTLEAIWADIERRGPRDANDNSRVASVTASELVIDSAWEPRVRSIETITRGDQQSTIVIISVEDMSMTVTGEIMMPKLGKAALSKAAKKEWDRFIGEVEKHELGHVNAAKEVAQAIYADAQAMRISGEAPTFDEAMKKAKADLEKAFAKIGGPTVIDKRIADADARYDGRTGHGPTLKVTIQ
jgi:predicted secreted Zn-dependent protease